MTNGDNIDDTDTPISESIADAFRRARRVRRLARVEHERANKYADEPSAYATTERSNPATRSLARWALLLQYVVAFICYFIAALITRSGLTRFMVANGLALIAAYLAIPCAESRVSR